MHLLDKFIIPLWATIRILLTMLAIKVRGLILIGSRCRVEFPDERLFLYFSFSPDPNETSYFDDYGIPDDEIFHYLDKWTELIKYAWTEHQDGWRISETQLVYADDIIAD